ncbi:hypothetical protein, partial [Bradyrhizobium sp. ARR65]|uniref:hypothetical protein n=1 Tax=Bradyrhizobium sp. ARR65 TaxID=1040989 RepID=UPI001AECA7C3
SSVGILASTAARLAFVTIAMRPSVIEAGCTNHTTDSGFGKTEIFLRGWLDGFSQTAARRANQLNECTWAGSPITR